ncbi:MAG: hypothetical protein QME77_06895 [bacterium]|nr:hypothetical protein [bacterium]
MDDGSVRVRASPVLTLAVLVFYAFAIPVAPLDVIGEMSEAADKKCAAAKASPLDPNLPVGRTVAGTLLPGPG